MKMSFDAVKVNFTDLGVEFLTTNEEFDNLNMRIGEDKFKILPKCGHIYEVRYGDFKNSMFKVCIDCARVLKDNGNLSYDEIKTRFEFVKCELLTTREEFIDNKMTTYSKYNFKATCGHNRCVILGNTKIVDNMLCSTCSLKQSTDNQVSNAIKDGLSVANISEFESLCFIDNLLKEEFDIKFLDEGCKADMIVKPKNINDDLWIHIQLKCCKQSKNNNKISYAFSINNQNYTNMVLICTCVKDQKIWIVDTEITKVCSRIMMNEIENTKYYKYKIEIDKFNETIHNLYNILPKYTFEFYNIPISESCKKEQKFRKLRESKLSIFNFIPPFRNYLVYDFKINNFKVQEKVAGLAKYGFQVSLCKGNGNNKKRSYEKNDNQYYWIHLPCEKLFYVFPEDILCEKGFISNDKTDKKKISLCIHPDNKEHWTYIYLHEYDNLNIEKLQEYFKI